ncbi:MAG: NAD(P)H:quinone oxidoreductase, type IV [Pseudonocardia sp. SCN 72-86]|nr:MAG: NAD(P)H:quinone oxidoreductase, type IV [Pseudonocardia sp. SCN 72-86]
MTARIAIIYYSATGNTARLARAFEAGAVESGAEVRVRQVAENAPDGAIDQNRRWRAHVDSAERVEPPVLEDLEWADGIAIGSPTRFGGPAAQLKAFLDTTGGLWAKGVLARKVGTSFTTASTTHGGLESTLLAMNNHFYHWGSIILPLGYAADQHLLHSGNPYGGSFVSHKSAAPDDTALRACHLQGRRLGEVASIVSAGLAARST